MREFTKKMLVSDGVKGCRTTKRCEGVDRQTLARDGTRALLKFYLEDSCLACGLGHSAALTVHRTVIHCRFGFESSRARKNEKSKPIGLLFWRALEDSNLRPTGS